jgi:hypothetical protein
MRRELKPYFQGLPPMRFSDFPFLIHSQDFHRIPNERNGFVSFEDKKINLLPSMLVKIKSRRIEELLLIYQPWKIEYDVYNPSLVSRVNK